jgi:hypothetical protein
LVVPKNDDRSGVMTGHEFQPDTILLYLARFLRFLAKILKILKNLERFFKIFPPVSNSVYICIYYILLLLLLYIYIRFLEFLKGAFPNGEKQSFFFSEGDPPFKISRFLEIRDK